MKVSRTGKQWQYRRLLATARILPVVGEEAALDPVLPVMKECGARPPRIPLGAACPRQVNHGKDLRGISRCQENVIAINAAANRNNLYAVQSVIAR